MPRVRLTQCVFDERGVIREIANARNHQRGGRLDRSNAVRATSERSDEHPTLGYLRPPLLVHFDC